MSGQDRGPIVVAVAVAMISASTVFVLLRLISRITIVKRVGLDDYLIIAAWVRTLTYSQAIPLSFSSSFSSSYSLPTIDLSFINTSHSQCTSFGLSFSIAYAVKYELGRHQDTIPLPDLEVLQRLEYAFSVLYVSTPAILLPTTLPAHLYYYRTRLLSSQKRQYASSSSPFPKSGQSSDTPSSLPWSS